METVTFAKVVENLTAGTELVRTNWKGEEETSIWTGKTMTTNNSTVNAYVFNVATKTLQSVGFETETEWRVKLSPNASPFVLGETGIMLAEAVALRHIDYLNLNKRFDSLMRDFDSFKSSAQEQLCDWATGGVLSDESLKEFSDVLESIGLEGIKRAYTVRVSVTYSVEVEVQATSEDDARDEVDNNLSDLIYDQIDLSYYEDYSIDDIEEA